jgi:hypothetical protein
MNDIQIEAKLMMHEDVAFVLLSYDSSLTKFESKRILRRPLLDTRWGVPRALRIAKPIPRSCLCPGNNRLLNQHQPTSEHTAFLTHNEHHLETRTWPPMDKLRSNEQAVGTAWPTRVVGCGAIVHRDFDDYSPRVTSSGVDRKLI